MTPTTAVTAAAAPTREPLTDGHGRTVGDVRISVTDRCDLRCQYCMPAEGLPWLEREAVLSWDEIVRLVGLLGELGVHGVRLTGGEPLVRRDLPELVRRLRALPGVHDLSLTTNGVLLERRVDELVEAGLGRINVSLDSLSRERFAEITRRDALERVLAGLAAAERHPSLRPIRVNAVAMRGMDETEVLAFAELARRTPYEVRFIEFMPLDADRAWTAEKVLTCAEIRATIAARWPLVPLGRPTHGTARRWAFADGAGELGFIAPVSEPFCSDCDRIRITAEGRLRTCLFSDEETDLRGAMRSGADDDTLVGMVRDAVWAKALRHRVGEPGFVAPARSMSRIGG